MGDGPIGPVAHASEKALSSLGEDRAGVLWIAEAYVVRDAFVQATAALERSNGLRVATGVVNPYSRHPAVLAMAIGTLQESYPGRFVLGLGSGESSWISALGLDPARPLSEVRAAVEFIRTLEAGKPATLESPSTTSSEMRIPRSLTVPELPIVIGGGGPRMLELAARKADGILLPFYNGVIDSIRECTAIYQRAQRLASPSIGSVAQCFVTGPWMRPEGRSSVERLVERMARLGDPPAAVPVALELTHPDALIETFEGTGIDEVAIVTPYQAVVDIAQFVEGASPSPRS
jgi:hypothetical protein